MELYRQASFYAERFCRRLARTLRLARFDAQAAAVAELRRFYRLGREPKLQHIERLA
jgi:uncharacterized protein with PIN domain